MRKNTLNFLLVLALIGVAGYVGKNYATWFPPEEVSSSEVLSSEEPILSDVLQLKLDLDSQGSFLYGEIFISEDFTNVSSIISNYLTNDIDVGLELTILSEYLLLTVPFIENIDFCLSPSVLDGLIFSEMYRFEVPGFYDFTGIIVETNQQVLTPIYTPLYV